MVESSEEVFSVGGYLGSRCALALLTNADLKPDIISAHNPLSLFHTLDILINGVLSDRYEVYSKRYSCLSKTTVTRRRVTITILVVHT